MVGLDILDKVNHVQLFLQLLLQFLVVTDSYFAAQGIPHISCLSEFGHRPLLMDVRELAPKLTHQILGNTVHHLYLKALNFLLLY